MQTLHETQLLCLGRSRGGKFQKRARLDEGAVDASCMRRDTGPPWRLQSRPWRRPLSAAFSISSATRPLLAGKRP